MCRLIQFSIWVVEGGGVQRPPPPMDYGTRKSAMADSVRTFKYIECSHESDQFFVDIFSPSF